MALFNPFTYAITSQMATQGYLSNTTSFRRYDVAPARDANDVRLEQRNWATYTIQGIENQYFTFEWKYTYYGNVQLITGSSTDESTVYWTAVRSGNDNLVRATSWVTESAFAKFSVTGGTDYEVESMNGTFYIVLFDTETDNYRVLDPSAVEAGVTFDASTTYLTGIYRMRLVDTFGETLANVNQEWADTMETAVTTARQEGYNEGYQIGLVAGADTTQSTANAFDVFGQAFGAVGSFMGTEILPNITIGTLVIVPTLVTMIVVIVRILKK